VFFDLGRRLLRWEEKKKRGRGPEIRYAPFSYSDFPYFPLFVCRVIAKDCEGGEPAILLLFRGEKWVIRGESEGRGEGEGEKEEGENSVTRFLASV